MPSHFILQKIPYFPASLKQKQETMNWYKQKRSNSPQLAVTATQVPVTQSNVKHEILLSFPVCKVHLMDEGEAIELADGDFKIIRISEDDVSIAIVIKIGNEIQWPLTKDEPVVKIDAVKYLFSLPMKDGNDPLSYGVTFLEQNERNLVLLDSFLKENSLFTCSHLSNRKKEIDWEEFAPRIEDYNNVLAKAIAGGTGQVVKGIFKLSNAYANQVHKGGETILIQEEKEHVDHTEKRKNKKKSEKKKNSVNKSLKRVRKLSKMTEKMSKTLLDGLGIASGSVMGPIIRSRPGKAFFTMVPGEVLLASLDALNRILDAAEAAEKQTMTATSGAVTRMVSKRFGENAAEATGDTLAAVGHVAGTAWNVFKIRKALNPASAVSSGVLKNAEKTVKN